MDMYYQKKLTAISNHRFETYVALQFQGLIAKNISKANITEKKGCYTVKSCTSDKYCKVDVSIGVCKMVHPVYIRQQLFCITVRSPLTTLLQSQPRLG